MGSQGGQGADARHDGWVAGQTRCDLDEVAEGAGVWCLSRCDWTAVVLGPQEDLGDGRDAKQAGGPVGSGRGKEGAELAVRKTGVGDLGLSLKFMGSKIHT